VADLAVAGYQPAPRGLSGSAHLAVLVAHMRGRVEASLVQTAPVTLAIGGAAAELSLDLPRTEMLRCWYAGFLLAAPAPATLDLLGQREMNEVWVEAGATLAGAFVREQLFDELVVYLAPTLLGPDARPLLDLPALAQLDARMKLRFTECVPVGDDLRITAVQE